MKNKNLIIITLITLIALITFNTLVFKKNERYQPSSPSLTSNIYKGPELVGDDPFKYLILSELSLQELNNFALSSKINLSVVKSYLNTFRNPLSLTTLNKAKYFSEIDIQNWDYIYNEYKKKYTNTTEDVILRNTSQLFNYGINEQKKPSLYGIKMIRELFEILGAQTILKINVKQNERFIEKNIELVDYSNLPITFETLDEMPMIGQIIQNFFLNFPNNVDLSIKIQKYKGKQFLYFPGVIITIFIKKDTYTSLNKDLNLFTNKIIDEVKNFDSRLKGANAFTQVITNEKGNKNIGILFIFKFDIIEMLNSNKGYTLYKQFAPKKVGIVKLENVKDVEKDDEKEYKEYKEYKEN